MSAASKIDGVIGCNSLSHGHFTVKAASVHLVFSRVSALTLLALQRIRECSADHFISPPMRNINCCYWCDVQLGETCRHASADICNPMHLLKGLTQTLPP